MPKSTDNQDYTDNSMDSPAESSDKKSVNEANPQGFTSDDQKGKKVDADLDNPAERQDN